MGLTGVITRRRAAHHPGRDRLPATSPPQRLPRPRRRHARRWRRPTTTSPTRSPGSTPLARGRLARSLRALPRRARDPRPADGRAAAADPLAVPGRRGSRAARAAGGLVTRPACAPSTRSGSARRRGCRDRRAPVDRPRSSTRSTAWPHWNRLYGPRGFVQYQFVVPDATGAGVVRRILEQISRRAAPVVPRRAQALRARQRRAAVVPASPAGRSRSTCPRDPGLAPLLDQLDELVVGRRRSGLPGQGLPARVPSCCAAMYPRLDEFRERARPCRPRPRPPVRPLPPPRPLTQEPHDQRTRPAPDRAPPRRDQRHRARHWRRAWAAHGPLHVVLAARPGRTARPPPSRAAPERGLERRGRSTSTRADTRPTRP